MRSLKSHSGGKHRVHGRSSPCLSRKDLFDNVQSRNTIDIDKLSPDSIQHLSPHSLERLLAKKSVQLLAKRALVAQVYVPEHSPSRSTIPVQAKQSHKHILDFIQHLLPHSLERLLAKKSVQLLAGCTG